MNQPQPQSIVANLFKNTQPLAAQGGGTSIADLKNIPDKPQEQTPQDINNSKIHYLVSNINKSLDEYAPQSQSSSDYDSDDSIKSNDSDTENVKNKSKTNLSFIKEPLLILIIYILLSQSFVRKSIGEYITCINPVDGHISFLGYVVYGTILALLFMFFKRIV